MRHVHALIALLISLATPTTIFAASELPPDMTGKSFAWIIVAAFIIAYFLVVWGEKHKLKKSVPTLIGAGIIWIIVGIIYVAEGNPEHIASMRAGFDESIVEIGQLTFFLITAMTYVITMQERNVFQVIRYRFLRAGLSQRQIFWATGAAAFVLSPVLDNLTTALALVSVVLAVGTATGDRKFVTLSAINLVVAANAGGAYSPFGDITTLMVWQSGKVSFFEFFSIFIPSLVNWLVPALIMSFAVKAPEIVSFNRPVALKSGAWTVIGLFALTLLMAVSAHLFLDLPPVIGMTTGLGLLLLFGCSFGECEPPQIEEPELPSGFTEEMVAYLREGFTPIQRAFNPMSSVRQLEWDTLLFFFGILLAVSGVAQMGYLVKLSALAYETLGPTPTNIAIGVLSAVVDNIPTMSAVLNMDPDMVQGQWMLVTLTAGVGGSLLSIGSAAGVTLMNEAKMHDDDGRLVQVYTFMSHLRWSWAIALGYAASIWVHTLLHTMH
ncbi:MAG TPA: sodium:proton antiporter [Rhodobacterales bacterium]|nr:sodium:proton antiporter [Rhodobacterales bacterium]